MKARVDVCASPFTLGVFPARPARMVYSGPVRTFLLPSCLTKPQLHWGKGCGCLPLPQSGLMVCPCSHPACPALHAAQVTSLHLDRLKVVTATERFGEAPMRVWCTRTGDCLAELGSCLPAAQPTGSGELPAPPGDGQVSNATAEGQPPAALAEQHREEAAGRGSAVPAAVGGGDVDGVPRRFPGQRQCWRDGVRAGLQPGRPARRGAGRGCERQQQVLGFLGGRCVRLDWKF